MVSAQAGPALSDDLRVCGRSSETTSFEDLAFRASCLVLADLVDQDWDIHTASGKIWISSPEIKPRPGENINDVKNRLRKGLLVGRNRQLAEPSVQAFLKKMKTPRTHNGRLVSIEDLVDDGRELASQLRHVLTLPDEQHQLALKSLIRPVVEVCEPGRVCPHTGYALQDIWRYFRHTWSLEYRPTPGRTLQILVRNEARPHAPVMGIAMLASACARLRIRDSWIGWTVEELQQQIASGEWDSEAVSLRLIESLNEALGEIRWDDMATLGEIQVPEVGTIHRLRQVAKSAGANRIQALKLAQAPGASYHESSTVDWNKASETPLFIKKRAGTLANLLEAKAQFVRAGVETDPGHALLSMLASASGRTAVKASLAEIRKRGLATNLLDVSICGAIRPYNELVGGKLVALLLASAEVSASYKERYSNHVSLIASQLAGRPVKRPAHIAMLTTTSLYGVGSSQYNRLSLRATDHPELSRGIHWCELGQTRGFGTAHLSKETADTLRDLSRLVHGVRRINNVFGEGASPRLRQIREGLDSLGLSGDSVLRHSTPRVVYACEVVPQARLRLMGLAKEDQPLPTVEHISDAWVRRWVRQRISRPEVLERMEGEGLSRAERARPLQLELSLDDA